MSAVVSLQAVVDEMDMLSDESFAYLHLPTGELVTLSREELEAAEREADLAAYPDWQQEAIRQAQEVLDSDDYLPLPSKFDIHEYAIMERFCLTFPDEAISQDLQGQIRGSGAFRRFKGAIHHYGIVEAWYQFLQAALEEIAIDWLEAHEIPYRRD